MENDLTNLLNMLLNVKSPWVTTSIEVDEKEKTVLITIDLERGSQFPCPKCGHMSKLHDSTFRSWRHLDLFNYVCYLNVKIPRTKCQHHGVKTIEEIPWGRMGSHYSFLFEAKVMRLCKYMSVSAISRELGEPDNNLWRVFHHYVDKALEWELDLEGLNRLCVDETSCKKGHSYVTIFTDIATGKVVYVTEGRKKDVFKELRDWLPGKNGSPSNIDAFSMDMSKSYIAGRREYFPDAVEVFDKFHLKKALNEAVDKVRKQEVVECEELKRTKYLWLKNEVNLTEQEKLLVHNFLVEGTYKTGLAYQLKQAYDQIWNVQPKSIEATLERWLCLAENSCLEPVQKFVKTIGRHYEGVLNAICSKINNGLAEGVNSVVQLAKSRARGYRNVKNFMSMIYYLGNDFKFTFH
jgi:transposase